MTDLLEKALAAMGRWPASRQEEAAEMLLALDRLGATYTAASLPATPRLPRRSVDFENEGSVAHDPEKWEPVFG